jgi:hypothetical protein
VCGELVKLRELTALDGRLIGSCGDAFTLRAWEAPDDGAEEEPTA